LNPDGVAGLPGDGKGMFKPANFTTRAAAPVTRGGA
jgi:hypothetical protein